MKTKKLAIKYATAIIIFCAFFVVAGVIKASILENTFGWIWGGSDDGAGNSTGVGWISMNNTNTAGGVSYGVNIPLTADGPVTGTAWSSNLGYIAFDNTKGYLTGCPSGTCSVSRVGDNIQGWARFVEIAKASAVGNSGGWLGWIKLNGTAQNGSKYGVSVGQDRKLHGSAWSDELGFIKFDGTTYGAALPPLPTVTMNQEIIKINIGTTTMPQTVTLGWTSTDATSCKASSTGGSWNQNNIGTSGSKGISFGGGTMEQFTITCQNSFADEDSAVSSVITVCYPKTCSSQTCSDDIPGMKSGVSDTTTCTNASTCSVDADCQTRSTQQWKEVAP